MERTKIKDNETSLHENDLKIKVNSATRQHIDIASMLEFRIRYKLEENFLTVNCEQQDCNDYLLLNTYSFASIQVLITKLKSGFYWSISILKNLKTCF